MVYRAERDLQVLFEEPRMTSSVIAIPLVVRFALAPPEKQVRGFVEGGPSLNVLESNANASTRGLTSIGRAKGTRLGFSIGLRIRGANRATEVDPSPTI